MALELRIPKTDLSAIAWLVKLDDQATQTLVGTLRSGSPTLSPRRLTRRLGESLQLDPKLAAGVLRALRNMYLVRFEANVPVPEVVDAICVAIGATDRPELKLDDEKRTRFQNLLAQVLVLEDTLGVLARGLDLMRDHERTLCRTRILTDVRPVFRADAKEDVVAAVLVHTLRLEYHSRPDMGEVRTFYVAMDGDDLLSLRTVIDRAINKEATMRRTLQQAGVPSLPEQPETDHAGDPVH